MLIHGRSIQHRRRRGVIAAVFLGMLLTASCSSTTTVSAEDPAVQAASDLADMRSALETIGSTEKTLVVACARRSGIIAQPAERLPLPDESMQRTTPSPSPAVAAAIGYGIAPRVFNIPTTAELEGWATATEVTKERLTTVMFGGPNQTISVELDDGYVANVGAQGCYAEVRKSFWGDLSEYAKRSWISSQAFGRTAQAVDRSADWGVKVSAWSACMARAGYAQINTPGGARDLVMAQMTSSTRPDVATYQRVSKFERTVATADAKCADESRTREAWIKVVAKNDSSYLIAHRQEIAEWADAVEIVAPKTVTRAIAAMS